LAGEAIGDFWAEKEMRWAGIRQAVKVEQQLGRGDDLAPWSEAGDYLLEILQIGHPAAS